MLKLGFSPSRILSETVETVFDLHTVDRNYLLLPVTPRTIIFFSPLTSFGLTFGATKKLFLNATQAKLLCLRTGALDFRVCFQSYSDTFAPGLASRASTVDY